MTRLEKQQSVLVDINNYKYSPNVIYLYPLGEYLGLLRKYCEYESNNDIFNSYIKESVLPAIDSLIQICIDGEKNKGQVRIEKDIKEIKVTAKKWVNWFKVACEEYSVDALSEKVI